MTVLVDIGTHKAEELRVLAGDRLYLAGTYIYWWYDWCKRQIKKVIKHKGRTLYGEGAYIHSPATCTLQYHSRCLKQIFAPKNFLTDMVIISFDPLFTVTEKYINKLKHSLNIYFLPVAILHHESETDYELQDFFQTKNTLSSSLFASGNAMTSCTYVSGFSFKWLMKEFLRKKLFSPTEEIVIRMNCEGAELGVINGLLEIGQNISNIFGSIGDIGKNFGDAKLDETIQLLEEKGVSFQYFKGSDPSTWGNALIEFQRLSASRK